MTFSHLAQPGLNVVEHEDDTERGRPDHHCCHCRQRISSGGVIQFIHLYMQFGYAAFDDTIQPAAASDSPGVTVSRSGRTASVPLRSKTCSASAPSGTVEVPTKSATNRFAGCS